MIVNWKCEDPDDSSQVITLERVKLLEVLENKVGNKTFCRVLTQGINPLEYKIWVDNTELMKSDL